MLARSEQNANCTYVAWSYPLAYSEPAYNTSNTAGSCFLKGGAPKVPTGATYRGLFAGAARGVVFSSVSQSGSFSIYSINRTFTRLAKKRILLGS
jgi:hypothetical protein